MTTSTTEATIAHLSLDTLHPHPDNPRLQLREDVIERLSAEIAANGFGPEHALLVRPVEGGHQIISGHHRLEAAIRAGLESVPAWVKDLDDDEAFMLLVLSNTQGELSKLENALHVYRYGERGEHGRGKKGGLSEYARRLDRKRQRVSDDFAVGALVENCRTSGSFPAVVERDPYSHLLEISKAEPACQPLLIEMLLKKEWTVAETKAHVEKLAKFEIPEHYREWLPLGMVASQFLKNDKFNPALVARLVKTADALFNLIEEDGTEEDTERLWDWLIANAASASWEPKNISEYHADMIREIGERREAEAAAEIVIPDGIDLRHGNLREILADIPDGSVDAIITDPPYPEEFLPVFSDLAILAKRVLKPGGICLVMSGQSYLPEVFTRLGEHLTYHWPITYLTPGGQAVQVWDRKCNTFYKPVLMYTKGKYDGDWFGDVTKSDVNDNDKEHHHWGQSVSGMTDLIKRFTKPGQLIVDPFLGGGTTAVVCHQEGRKFVGCDIDETAVQTTIGRFAPEADQ